MRAVVVVSVIIVFAGCATAQDSASPVTGLETEFKQKRFVVLPRPTPEEVANDVAAAAGELEAAERREELINQVIRPPRRPDLDESVTSGIQSRNLGRALSR